MLKATGLKVRLETQNIHQWKFGQLEPVDVDAVAELILPTHQWNMAHYETLMAHFERFEDKEFLTRMIAVNRMVISLLKTGTTNEF
ncbi:hypothetical protein N9E35_01645 [Candidatus Marinimicrobia bacterium]|nr:hypothetical protein [Candidatus Neomarinimicrobiota bacterium]